MRDKIDVLDKGFVRLVDHYGGDGDIVAAARVSTSGLGVEATSSTRGLLRYLLRHRHTTPFEMVDFKFHIKAPIFVVRQWHRHRTFSYNEMSGRYSELPAEWYVPEEDRITFQSKKNKQGSEGKMEATDEWRVRFDQMADEEFNEYNLRLEKGMARELARINLPVSTYTEFYAKGNLHNWLHFLSLRMDSHAQYEIRMFANAIGEMIKERCPMTWQAFEDYNLNAMYLTSHDVEFIKYAVEYLQKQCSTFFIAEDDGTPGGIFTKEFPTNREEKENLDKLERLGFKVKRS